MHNLIANKHCNKGNSFEVPVINLSSNTLGSTPLRYGLCQSFVDKCKCIKKDLSIEFEVLLTTFHKYVEQSDKENFHKYLTFQQML